MKRFSDTVQVIFWAAVFFLMLGLVALSSFVIMLVE